MIKYSVLVIFMFIISNVMAYDGKVKDDYGRVTGYFRVDDNKQITTVYDIYGRKMYTLEMDEKTVHKVEEKHFSD